MESDRSAAAADLAALDAGRAALADRAQQPWWYDAALGGIVFALLATASLRNTPLQFVVDVLALLGLAALKAAYTRRAGFWVSGLRPGRTRKVVRVWLPLYCLVVALAVGAEYGLGWRGAMAVAGVVLGVSIALVSRWWTRVYVAELREGA
jgi:hypothetical protein